MTVAICHGLQRRRGREKNGGWMERERGEEWWGMMVEMGMREEERVVRSGIANRDGLEVIIIILLLNTLG